MSFVLLAFALGKGNWLPLPLQTYHLNYATYQNKAVNSQVTFATPWSWQWLHGWDVGNNKILPISLIPSHNHQNPCDLFNSKMCINLSILYQYEEEYANSSCCRIGKQTSSTASGCSSYRKKRCVTRNETDYQGPPEAGHTVFTTWHHIFFSIATRKLDKQYALFSSPDWMTLLNQLRTDCHC